MRRVICFDLYPISFTQIYPIFFLDTSIIIVLHFIVHFYVIQSSTHRRE